MAICFRLLLGPSHTHVKADLTARLPQNWGIPTPPPLLLQAGKHSRDRQLLLPASITPHFTAELGISP